MNFILLFSIFAYVGLQLATAEDLVWGYECQSNRCVKVELTQRNYKSAVSLPVCRIYCGADIGTLWPKPTGQTKLGTFMAHINPSKIVFNINKRSKFESLWEVVEKRFHDQIEAKIYEKTLLKSEGTTLRIDVTTNDDGTNQKLTFDTDESYKLVVNKDGDDIVAKITAETVYGARHAIETLSQVIVYDNIRRELQCVGEVEINDAPVYKHRGLMLDTSRNYYSVKSIKRIIDAMGMVKLNTFHWHITDSHSFPFVVKSQPDLYKLGAYSARKVYTHESIAEIVKYGRARGVRVLPEFDQPAHVGEGWQANNLTVCFNAQPWEKYCVEPPCGQLDPTNDKVYDVLEDIYREMYEAFDQPDYFHIGGDEVSVNCWNTSSKIQNWMLKKGWKLEEEDFMKLWGHFQVNALARFDKITKSSKPVPVIFWTSRLTEVPFVDSYLDPKRYTIQIWTTGFDSKISDLLQRGYNLIMSNYDALYLDCGFGGWVTDGNNWCAPYIGWQKVYENNPKKIAGEYHSQVIGSEAAIWSEQIDEHTIDSRLWPRASALAERLWSDPVENWKLAEARMIIHRERLVENEIAAESIQPEWCLQNENECPIDAYRAKNG